MRDTAVRFDRRRYRILRPRGVGGGCVLLSLLGLLGCLAQPHFPPDPAEEAEAKEPPASVVTCQTVTESEVFRLSSGASLLDILRTRVPSLQASAASWQSRGSSSRGLRGNNSFVGPSEPLVFVDGIRLPQPGGIEYLEIIDPLDVAGIEILRGPATTALYGTGASGGVLLIYSKRGVDNASDNREVGAGCRL